jgi:hypothetical protein
MAGWGTPIGAVEVPEARLTPRGRLVVALLLVAAMLVGLSVAAGRLGAGGLAVAAAAGAEEAAAASVAVVVSQGDSLWSIALHVAPDADPRETVARIRERNDLASNLIQPGQVLHVPLGRP